MSEIDWRICGDAEEMAEAVADEIEAVIRMALDEHGEALIAMPGARSPTPVFRRLAKAEIAWDRVTLVPTDDRLVPPAHPLSNVSALIEHFEPVGARIVPMAGEAADYRRAGRDADARLAGLRWPLDLVWLGVGVDGHTASIFPGPDLVTALGCADERRALGVMPDPLPPEAPVARVTLSLAAILSARLLMLSCAGDIKRAVVERAIAEGPASTAPVGRVLALAKRPVAIYWSPA
ncbi:MAG: 6-phosphogluconolactonase [Parvibaculum sp.]|uniref:6-phosphogluconolactonase n=1 Tax=Parvibaculum sp. TaxID=2024848 RepID=UPI0025E49FE0|nr:6-phosphogluconolactonase [Parvibaculum sp.]MCE9651130.1 6-phosphogluconolactonase [Parvibaculum sp.]